MLSCSNCDASLKLNAKLCIKCGHIVTDEERESAVTGIPIKKPVVIPEVIVQKVVIPEPSKMSKFIPGKAFKESVNK